VSRFLLCPVVLPVSLPAAARGVCIVAADLVYCLEKINAASRHTHSDALLILATGFSPDAFVARLQPYVRLNLSALEPHVSHACSARPLAYDFDQ
jgi:hypothetical protein